MNQKEENYIKSLLTSIAILGLLIKLYLSSIVNVENSNYKAESTIIGYGLVLCCVSALIFFKINIKNDNPIEFMKMFFNQSIPYLLVISLLSFIIYLNVKFIDKINSEQVGDQYNIISGVSTFMFLFQLYFLYKYYSLSLESKYNKNSSIELKKKNFKMMSYVITPINFSLVGIIYIILNLFLTDG